jgi:hypothetical protein
MHRHNSGDLRSESCVDRARGGGVYISVPVVTQAGALCRRDDRRRRCYCTFSYIVRVCTSINAVVEYLVAHTRALFMLLLLRRRHNIITLLARSCELLRSKPTTGYTTWSPFCYFYFPPLHREATIVLHHTPLQSERSQYQIGTEQRHGRCTRVQRMANVLCIISLLLRYYHRIVCIRNYNTIYRYMFHRYVHVCIYILYTEWSI